MGTHTTSKNNNHLVTELNGHRRHVVAFVTLAILAIVSFVIIMGSIAHLYSRTTELNKVDARNDQHVARVEQHLCGLEAETRKDIQKLAQATHVHITVSPASPGTCQ